tara:strand:+ start:760 stop:1650 length:891 start_codon:yes stop_codon:yes gene_type:complete
MHSLVIAEYYEALVMVANDESKAWIRRDKAKEAIALALESKWKEATALNTEIIEENPRDVEAYNRLGKAFSEQGKYREAEDAFRKAVEISPANVIARKNLQRLVHLKRDKVKPKNGYKVTPELFIEERGKTTTISLDRSSSDKTHLRMTPGDLLVLHLSGNEMIVQSPDGGHLGTLEYKLGIRLARLMSAGNQYTAAVTSVDEKRLVVMIKETHRDPSQSGVVSFPPKRTPRGSYSNFMSSAMPVDLELEEAEEEIDRSPIIEWDEEGEANIAAPPSDSGGMIKIVRDEDEEESVL